MGAGTGSLALLVGETYHPARLVLTDFDDDQVKKAELNLQSAFGSVPSNFVLQKADALNLQFPDETFDSVFAYLVIHHFSKHEWSTEGLGKGLDEIERVLKPRGQFVYAEMFEKNKIKEYLMRKGFQLTFQKSFNLGLAELVVATKKELRDRDFIRRFPLPFCLKATFQSA